MFSAPLPGAPDTLAKFPDPVAGTEDIESRARAYLHANCSHCHRPQGGGQGTMDLRFATTFTDTDTCNAMNTQGPINGAMVLVAPGDAAQSVLSQRVHATDAKRMPPVSVSVIDDSGARVIDDWIASLTACP
jgi:mono/diheme cytochrome c family protein